MNCGVIKVVLVAFLALSAIISTASAFGVSGAILSEEVSPGQEIVHEITVSAGEDELPNNITAEIYGFERNEYEVNLELDPEDDTGAYSARSFLSLEPKSFYLEPGRTETLLLTGFVPEDVGSGGRYALVTIKTAPEESKASSVMVVMAIQVPVLLKIRDSELVMTGEVSSFTASTIDGNVSADLLFENTGNVHYKPLVGAVLLDEDGTVVARFEPAETKNSILPTGSRLVQITLVPESELQPGTYTVVAEVTLDDGTVLDTEEATFEV